MKLITYILFLCTVSLSIAQTDLNGLVLDKTTNEPIVFANIYFPQLEKGTSTNENGAFTIKNVPNGTYKIIISYVGYETYSKSISIPPNASMVFELTASAIEMEDVIVSIPFHKLQSENVMKVERETVSAFRSEWCSYFVRWY